MILKDPELALDFTKTELQKLPTETWVIPQSGGKDSRTVAQSAMVLIERGLVEPPERMIFIMADTVMEFWTFMDQAKRSLVDMTARAKALGINAEWHIARPIIQDDFWVRIIGRGMTPPTSNMRWCTDTPGATCKAVDCIACWVLGHTGGHNA